MRELRVLMVCLGNICRSPMADGLLRKKVNDAGLNVFVDSAGTSNHHKGQAPDERMRETAAQFGVPIDDFRARQFEVSDFDNFDWIYVMDDRNYQNVLRLARNKEDQEKVKMILNEVSPGNNAPVPDPYYGGQRGFEEVFDLLDEATDIILNKIKETLNG
ncbi:MAG: low molecular weight phosphotyrosine protein phosphatase [Crocinitomicaceae bacterium]|nr:low molecular weight phosphotyrosine protein phosphatase [Crocinitomicaceae bacterium]